MLQNYPLENRPSENYPSEDYSSESSASSFYSAVQLLPIKLPAAFDQSLGLQHPARWLGLYWEPQLDQVCYTDGEDISTGNAQSWQLFCTHPQIEPVLAPYYLGNDGRVAQHFLLLDRQTNRLYVGESVLVEDYLRHPESLNLLAELDASLDAPWRRSLQSWQTYLPTAVKDRRLLFLVGLPVIAIAFRLLHEVGEFIFELPELWHD